MTAKKLTKREEDMLGRIDELTQDLQRLQADFENFRKRSETESANGVAVGKRAAILMLLPVIDDLERGLAHQPEDLKGHEYVDGIQKIATKLQKSLADMGVSKIEAANQDFNPDLMEAVQVDGEGDHEVVAEELQTGYVMNNEVIRHAMVKVVRK